MKKIVLIVLALSGFLSLNAQYIYPFHNLSLTDEERVDNLLSLMTIDEKIQALSTNLGVPRLGIKSTGHSEGLHGLALGGQGNWGGFKLVNNEAIPDAFPTTTFPQAYGLGATWDRQLIKQVADIEAMELRYYVQNPQYNKGGLIMRAPNADLARDPRWGRTEESFGEDPFLVGELTVAFVKGLQGNNPRYWKAASLMKHFLANSNEDGRDSTSSNFDNRLFHEYYAYPFYKGITEGGSRAFMASYNGWNGTAMTVHPVLKQITRDRWGNNGIICTDGGALKLLVEAHKAFPNLTEGAAAIVKATVGQFLDDYKPYIYDALNKGLLTEKDIDNAIKGNFIVALKLGFLDADQIKVPYTEIGVTVTVAGWKQEKTKDFVRQVTAKSVILLKNEKQLLPLDKSKIKSIAVIGPRANEVLLDWYSGTPPYTITILEGIKNAVGEDVEIFFEPSNVLDKATIAAQKADIAIVCVGNHPYGTDPKWKYSPVPSDGREAVDRKALSLEQEDLVKIVYKANPNSILVLVSSFPYTINWSQEHIPAILHITNNSQELGNGLADVIFGKYNPAGRTTQTWVRSITDLPPMMDYDIRNGRTYMYAKNKPLFPFGYGLSYSDFVYSNINLSSSNINKIQTVTVSADIKNEGKMDGEEVVQLYVSFPDSKIQRPVKQLKGFERIMIKKGESRRIEFKLTPEAFAYWDENTNQFAVETGNVNIMLGSSSEDIRLRTKLKIKK